MLGIGSVLLLFAVARRLWSLEVALLAGLLLAGQRFFIHLSRAGYHYIDTPFVSLLAVWLFLRLWQDGRLGAAVWCGIVLGLGIQTYYASRLVPVLLGAHLAGLAAGTPRRERRARLRRARRHRHRRALAVAAPMFGYFAHDWADVLGAHARHQRVQRRASRQHLAYGYSTDNLGRDPRDPAARGAVSLFNVTARQLGAVRPTAARCSSR